MMLGQWWEGLRWSVGWRHVSADRLIDTVVSVKIWVKGTLLVWTVGNGHSLDIVWALSRHMLYICILFGWGQVNWAKTSLPRILPGYRIFRAFTSLFNREYILQISKAHFINPPFFWLFHRLNKFVQKLFTYSKHIIDHVCWSPANSRGLKLHPYRIKNVYRHRCLWMIFLR